MAIVEAEGQPFLESEGWSDGSFPKPVSSVPNGGSERGPEMRALWLGPADEDSADSGFHVGGDYWYRAAGPVDPGDNNERASAVVVALTITPGCAEPPA